MAETKDFKSLFDKLDGLLSTVDLSDVTAESAGFTELPDGYYLCEVEKTEIRESKSSKMPMAAFTFKILEDGYTAEVNESGETVMNNIKKTANRKIFIYYVFKDERSVKRFATDMLKFEGEEEGEPLLPKEAFLNADTVNDALEILTGMRIYVHVSTTVNEDDTKTTWNNLISWKRAKALDLPC